MGTPKGTAFINTFESENGSQKSVTSSQNIESFDSQEVLANAMKDFNEMELPADLSLESQVLVSKSQLKTSNLLRLSSYSLISEDEIFYRTPEEKPSRRCGNTVSVDTNTSNWKFALTNLDPPVKKRVSDFISSLKCHGIVDQVDETVTHIIVGTGTDLKAQRTLKFLQGTASGIMMISHIWIDMCLLDRDYINLIDRWVVTDIDLDGSNGPWRARKWREEGRAPLLSGYELVIDGQLEGLDSNN